MFKRSDRNNKSWILCVSVLALFSTAPIKFQSYANESLSPQISSQKQKIVLTQELQDDIKNHLKTDFQLSLQKTDELYDQFQSFFNHHRDQLDDQLASSRPYFIAMQLWRLHQEQSYLYGQGTKALSLDVLMFAALRNHVKLERLSFTTLSLSAFVNVAKSNPYLISVEFFQTPLTIEHMKILSTLHHLKELIIKEGDVTDESLPCLLHLKSLQKLSLPKNKITAVGAETLAQHSKLKELDLYKNQAGDRGARALALNEILERLDLRENDIKDEGAIALSKSKALKVLFLGRNHISDRGAFSFKDNPYLTYLELIKNSVSADLILFLQEVIKNNNYIDNLKEIPQLPLGYPVQPRTKVRIVSIDGGGIRGLLPALVLQHIEQKVEEILGQGTFYFAKNVDMMTGTSTGGLIGLGLTLPGEKGKPKYRTDTLVNLYKEKGPIIFPNPIGALNNLAALFRPRYDPQNLEKVLKDYFGETYIKSSLCHLLLTSFNLIESRDYIFDSKAAAYDPNHNFLYGFAGRSTSAAPTYFPEATVTNEVNTSFRLVDGGIYANNPTLLALRKAQQLYPNAEEYQVISLGTGHAIQRERYENLGNAGLLGWAPNVANVLMNNMALYTEKLMKEECQKDPRVKLYRIQTELKESETGMDDVSPENIQNLIAAAQMTIEKEKETLDAIIELFVKNYGEK